MDQDKRDDARRSFNVNGRLYAADGALICACRLRDVSEGGARIGVVNAEQVPDEVIVALARYGNVRRKGRVAWRKGNELGIRFSRPDKPARGGVAREAKEP
jgi:hypothetical protein